MASTMPRWRVQRSEDGPVAGSSRLPDPDFSRDASSLAPESNDEDFPTPKLPVSTLDPDLEDSSAARALRLRELLSRVSNSDTPTAKPRPSSPSVLDSDYDLPKMSPREPSHAQDSLKDLFSRIWEQPGDTPQKPGRPRRRNSIDVSEVESSPRVQRERAKNKGKRRSLSDEETDRSVSKSQTSRALQRDGSERSEASFVSSQAATFDLLRQRLTASQTEIMDQNPPTLHNDYPMTGDETDDTETFLHGLRHSGGAPDPSTSTPQDNQTLNMSAKSDDPFNSRLLDHDSEMHHEMNRLDSFDVSASATPFPSSEALKATPTTARPRHKSRPSFAAPTDSSKRHSIGLHRSSSRSSLGSSTQSQEDQDSLHEKELSWNKSRPTKSPSLNRHSYHGATQPLPRRGSAASMSSTSVENDISTASRDSMVNHSKGSRPRSSLSLHSPRERVRTMNTPAKPNGSSSRPTPSLPVHSNTLSISSSRPSSPSLSSMSIEEPFKREVVHERERNWNSPRPRWGDHPNFGRSNSLHSLNSASPVSHRTRHNSISSSHTMSQSEDSVQEPNHDKEKSLNSLHTKRHSHAHSSSPLPTKEPSSSHSRSQSHHESRQRSGSLQVPDSPSVAPSPRSKASISRQSPSPQSVRSLSRHGSHIPRPHSPIPPSVPKSAQSAQRSLKFGSHTLPHSDEPSKAIDLSALSPERSTISRPVSSSGSHIPVRASSVPTSTPASFHTMPDVRRDRSNSVPQIVVDETSHDEQTDDLFSSADPSPPSLNTPLPPSPPPDIDRETSESPVPTFEQQDLTQRRETDEARLHRAIRSPPSPPPSPPNVQDNSHSHSSILVTPPRKSASPYSPPQLEYKTPSPPKNLPALPGPPSLEDEDELQPPSPIYKTPARRDSLQLTNGISNLTIAKTPAPPGAWAATPLPKQDPSPDDEFESKSPSFAGEFGFSFPRTPKPPGGWSDTPAPIRTTTVPTFKDEDEEVSQESGLATPADSLSRSNNYPIQTPAPPGAYATTPAPRKSILKVRFDAGTTNGSAPSTDNQSTSFDALPLPSPSSSSPGSPRGHRRATSVRLVDSMGRPQAEEASILNRRKNNSPRKANGSVRILDAMGRQLEDEQAQESSVKLEDEDEDEEVQEEPTIFTREEALSRVRRGLSDLALGLDEINRSTSSTFSDKKVEVLRDISNAARKTRDRLTETLREEESELDKLRHRSRWSKFLMPGYARTKSGTSRGFFFLSLLMHFLLACFVLRVLTLTARQYFLTSYYDPFYPDIHTYTSIPEPHRDSPTFISAVSRGNWKILPGSLWDDLSMVFIYCQKHIWERWGTDSSQNLSSWPPT